MVAESEHQWRGAQLYDLGQGELDGCGVHSLMNAADRFFKVMVEWP